MDDSYFVLSMVSDLEARKRWAALEDERNALQARFDLVRQSVEVEIQKARMNIMEEALAAVAVESDEIENRFGQREEAAALASRIEDVDRAQDALGLTFDLDDGWDIQRCALSRLPILDGDEVLTDEETGERFLRCLLPVPCRDETATDVLRASVRASDTTLADAGESGGDHGQA